MLDREIVQDHGESKLRSRLVMSTSIRAAILERNQELRRNPGALQEPEWARWTLSIPALDWEHLKKKYPDLAQPAGDIKDAALAKFMASPESEPYKVR